jgi:hypothetical protein
MCDLDNLYKILKKYKEEFQQKQYIDEYLDSDILMETFGLTQEIKGENKQYWGRQLGMCWQLLVTEVFKDLEGYKPALKIGDDEPCDLIYKKDAIDTKYRVGSGDSGTLKKFKQYGKKLIELDYIPTLLFVRTDNLPAAITACEAGQWKILTGQASFNYIKNNSGFDLYAWLMEHKNNKTFYVRRK